MTLAWLMRGLRGRSYGIVILVLALLGSVPLGSTISGPLIFIPAIQMIMGRPYPAFPRFIGERPFRVDRLERLIGRATPILRVMEKAVRPRWPTPFLATRRVVGFVVLLLGALLLAPVPLSNIVPAFAIMLIAFAHLEEDGILLSVALIMALGVVAVVAGAIWETL